VDGFLQEVWLARGVILAGARVTTVTAILSIAAGTVLGTIVGLVLTYALWPLRWVTRAYVDFIRGTPVLVLVLASFYVLSIVRIQLSALQAGVLALAVFCSAHVAEIMRGALQALAVGQTDAAKAIGLTFPQTFLYVLLPQALRQMLPTWVNTATEIVKASTLLSIIGVPELLLSIQEIISRNFMSLQFYLLAGAIYFAIDLTIERIGRAIERKVALP
jgi:polar amino acid transport system permease protein